MKSISKEIKIIQHRELNQFIKGIQYAVCTTEYNSVCYKSIEYTSTGVDTTVYLWDVPYSVSLPYHEYIMQHALQSKLVHKIFFSFLGNILVVLWSDILVAFIPTSLGGYLRHLY